MGGLKRFVQAVKDGAVGTVQAVEKAGEAAVQAVAAPAKAAVAVAQGQNVGQALRDAIAQNVGAVAAVADVAAAFQNAQTSVTAAVASGTLGQSAANIVMDVQRISQPLDPNDAAGVAEGVRQFVQTGNINLLNPAAILMSGEIERCRGVLRGLNNLTDVPNAVVNGLPDELRALCQNVKVCTSADVPGDLNAPRIAIDHLHRASAMTLVDVIVFDAVPGFASDADKFLWAHELTHVQQYANLGIQGFCARYMAEELSPHGEGWEANALEVEADHNACRFYPTAQPSYIARCPV